MSRAIPHSSTNPATVAKLKEKCESNMLDVLKVIIGKMIHVLKDVFKRKRKNKPRIQSICRKMGYKSYHARFYCFIILKHAKIKIKNQIITELSKNKIFRKEINIQKGKSLKYNRQHYIKLLHANFHFNVNCFKNMIQNYLMLEHCYEC